MNPVVLPVLCAVKRGEIVAVARTAVLRHRTVDLSAAAFAALAGLRRDRLVELDEGDVRDGWIVAHLTEAGELLLRRWTEYDRAASASKRACSPDSSALRRRVPTRRSVGSRGDK
jgi:hypothetical protein